MILFVNDNSGILFLRTVTEVVARFLKITSITIVEYITQVITIRDSDNVY